MAVVVGDTAEVEELVGEISNPISFSNSLGLKSDVVCNCGRVEGGGSDGGAIVSFFCFFVLFFLFFLTSTAFDIVHRYGIYHFL